MCCPGNGVAGSNPVSSAGKWIRHVLWIRGVFYSRFQDFDSVTIRVAFYGPCRASSVSHLQARNGGRHGDRN